MVLSLFISFVNRINDLERYRDLDEHRVEQLVDWVDDGGGRQLADDLRALDAKLDRAMQLAIELRARLDGIDRRP